MFGKKIEILKTGAIAFIERENLTSDELERLAGTEELEVAANSTAAAVMSRRDFDERGRIYSVANLRGSLADEDDDTNETVRIGLEQLVAELDGFQYFWLV